jgi:hypothetical protein
MVRPKRPMANYLQQPAAIPSEREIAAFKRVIWLEEMLVARGEDDLISMELSSAGASLAAIIHIARKVIDLCPMYYMDAQEARMHIQHLQDQLISLQDALTNMQDQLEAPRSTKLSILMLINQHNGPLQECQNFLRGLAVELGKNKTK